MISEKRESRTSGVLAAIGRVHRQKFVDQAFLSRSYHDEALPIGLKQTISQPFTVAYQSQTLNPQPGERILEIGTGSGYQAAVLCEMGSSSLLYRAGSRIVRSNDAATTQTRILGKLPVW